MVAQYISSYKYTIIVSYKLASDCDTSGNILVIISIVLMG